MVVFDRKLLYNHEKCCFLDGFLSIFELFILFSYFHVVFLIIGCAVSGFLVRKVRIMDMTLDKLSFFDNLCFLCRYVHLYNTISLCSLNIKFLFYKY